MLSYRHAFHAGNYADVLKHCVLIDILSYMVLKDKPLCYLDTHAGAGMYHLGSKEAVKTSEFEQGVMALLQIESLPQSLQLYRQQIEAVNHGEIRKYPGSPTIAQNLLRPYDRLLLCEMHPADSRLLQKQFGKVRNASCFEEDGYQKSLALLPPPERRGVVLIDPSYEVKDEYQWVVDYLKQMVRRFATGVYAIWYPIADEDRSRRMIQKIKTSGIPHIQQFELGLTDNHKAPGMTGTGMLVVNPPWNLKAHLSESLPVMAAALGPTAYWRIDDLVEEGG